MRAKLKTKLFATIALIAVLGGVTAAAVTAAQPSGHHARHSRLAPAAAYLGVSEAQLQSDLRGGRSLAQIADATPGHSAAGLVEAIVTARRAQLASISAGLKERVTRQVERVGGPAATPRSVAAAYLGLAPAELRAKLRSGMTLAQIASSVPGRSEAGLVDALLAGHRKALDAKVARHTITPAQEQRRLARLAAHVRKLVNRVHPAAVRPAG